MRAAQKIAHRILIAIFAYSGCHIFGKKPVDLHLKNNGGLQKSAGNPNIEIHK
jgi:hypothetical protein